MQRRLGQHVSLVHQKLCGKRGVVIPQFDRPDYDKHIELLKTQMRTEDFERTWVDRANMSIGEACEYALQINWLKIKFPIG